MSDTFNQTDEFDNLLVELQGRSKEDLEAVAFDAMFIESSIVPLNSINFEQGAGARWCRQETI